MDDVKPWEPVKGGYSGFDIWEWEESECQNLFLPLGEPKLHVTLANGQRIIVRVKS